MQRRDFIKFLGLHAIYRNDTPPGPAASWLIAGSKLKPKKWLFSAMNKPRS